MLFRLYMICIVFILFFTNLALVPSRLWLQNLISFFGFFQLEDCLVELLLKLLQLIPWSLEIIFEIPPNDRCGGKVLPIIIINSMPLIMPWMIVFNPVFEKLLDFSWNFILFGHKVSNDCFYVAIFMQLSKHESSIILRKWKFLLFRL